MLKQEIVPHEQYTKTRDTLSDWKKSFAKHKVSLQIARGVNEGTERDQGYLQTVNTVLNNQQMQEHLMEIKQTLVASFTNQDVNTLVAYLFCMLTYGNWQRAGAAINLTIAEATNQHHKTKGPDRFYTVSSAIHKTALTHGPAVMCLINIDINLFLHNLQNVRPTMPSAPSMSTKQHQPLHNYIDYN